MTPGCSGAGRDVNDQIMGSRDLLDTISTGPTYLDRPEHHYGNYGIILYQNKERNRRLDVTLYPPGRVARLRCEY